MTPGHQAEQTLREVIDALAPIERRAGSSGEQQAAAWLAQRLRAAGCDAQVEEEQFLDGYARVIGSLASASALAGVTALVAPRVRKLAGAAAAAATLAIADDVSNGPRLFRRAAAERKTTWNVVGSCGDPDAARTLVVLAHHDAAPTGKIFDQRLQAALGERFPGLLERIDTSLPLWWLMVGMPALVALGAARGRRGTLVAGTAGSVVGVATFADVARSPIVPGANDNLTAVAVLVALAERLRDEPMAGLRVLLASCGAEEVIQGGIYGFARRHFAALDRARTWVLNLETVGSPKLILLEGEGPVVMEDYHDRSFRDLVARAAEYAGAPLQRGLRVPRLHRRRGAQSRRLSDRDARVDEPLQGAVELPPDERRPGERRLHHRPAGADGHRSGRARAGLQSLDRAGVAAVPLASELELPAFDHTDPSLRGERYRAAMAALRGHDGWLASCPFGFIVLDRESVEFFLRSKDAVFPGLTIADLFGIADGPLHEEIVKNIINVNGADHRRLRNLVNPALAPRAVDRYRPAMQQFLAELLDDLPPDGRCEFIGAFAKPYPSLVIAEVMGAPHRYAPKLHEWSNWIQRQFDATSLMEDRARIEQAVSEFYVWADELIADRRRTPGTDLITDLIAAEEQGERLSHDELRNLVLNVLVGGVDTSQSQLAHAMRLLASRPEQWQLLRSDPRGLALAAVDETIRFEPITPFTARITIAEVEHRGVTFPPGTVVLVSAWHANREGVDPDEFDITADRGGARVLTFGAGIHYCVGANLARAEMQEGLAAIAERVSSVTPDGDPEFGTPSGIYGLESLPLRFAA